MKKYIYILFAITILILPTLKVNAVYDKEKEYYLDQIKEAEQVEFKYYINNNYYDDEGNKINGIFNLEISNIKDYMKIKIYDLDINLTSEDIIEGKITLDNIPSGIKKLGIYNDQYNYLLKSITLNIPKYNYYAEKEECIDKEDLDVCDKWYEYELNDSTFNYKIKKYEENRKNLPKQNNNNNSNIFIKFLSKYYIYIISPIILIAIIIIFIISKKKRYSLD